MAEIHRFSSRRQRLDHAFLANRLKGATSYKRIAGYFRSSIFDLVGEEIADIPHVQMVCNSELDAADVGVGKMLSLAASAMISALLDDGPVLILCPATLTLQWQVELKDKLGIPSAVWLSHKKVWVDEHGHTIKTRGPEDITRCPFRIAVVSTGLIFHDSDERRCLLERKFGTVVIFRGDAFVSVDRDDIKKAVKQRDIRLVVAADAACEGLNLQTLGTLINVDLPWNPSRLEQRLGRITGEGPLARSPRWDRDGHRKSHPRLTVHLAETSSRFYPVEKFHVERILNRAIAPPYSTQVGR